MSVQMQSEEKPETHSSGGKVHNQTLPGKD